MKFAAGTTFSCLATLFVFNTGINYAFPDGLPKYRETEVPHSKIPSMVKSDGKPDVLLLGASGIVIPSVRCDDDFHKRESRYDQKFMLKDIWGYARSDYFANLLSRKLNRDVTIDNTGAGGCIMSDQYLILRNFIDAGKTPKYLLITTGPKDFFDNLKPELGKTPLYGELASLPVRLSDIVEGNTKLDNSIPEMTDSMMRATSKYYFFRDDYRSFLAKETSAITKHPESLQSLEPKRENPATPKLSEAKASPSRYIPSVSQDVHRFQKIYLPINKSHFDKQFAYLQKTIDLAKANNIAVQIVFMPLVDEHTAILKPDAWNMYKARVAEIAANSHVTCLDPQQDIGFAPSDFEDSAHLNSTGGRKFFAYLTDKIAGDPQVASALDNHGVLIGQH